MLLYLWMPAYNKAEDLPRAKHLLTVAQVAHTLGVTPMTVRNLIHRGKLGAILRKWRYGCYERHAFFIPKQELQRYMLSKVMDKHAWGIKWFPAKDTPFEPTE